MRQQHFWCDYCNQEVSPDKITCQIQYVKINPLSKKIEPIITEYCFPCQTKIIKAVEDLKNKEVSEEFKKGRELEDNK